MTSMRSIFVDWRLGRIIMFILITGSVSFGLGNLWINIILAGLLGATLSAGGFYLDYLGDYKRDRESGKLSNPIAKGTISPRIGMILIALLLSISIMIGLFVNIWILLPIGGIIFVISGLIVGILDTPFLRAFSLGLLQAFYVMIGGLMVYRFELGIILLSLYLFFAMTGGRVLGDIRDLPHDEKTDVMTLPKKYGLQTAGYFLLINELIAYIFGLLVYFTRIFGIGYLICIILTIAIGLPMTLFFVYKPSPKIANIVNMMSFGILGMLFIIGMIVGKV
ncbi:MAG: UbiA family prenyltransferase [Candidatus Hodarchaeota archaeon]